MSDLETKLRELEYERAVLVNNLDWARATFRLIGRDDYANGVDELQKRYGLPPIAPTREDYYTIRRGPRDG